jgi:hypothetical protein
MQTPPNAAAQVTYVLRLRTQLPANSHMAVSPKGARATG